jgi:hypothetical protein
MNKSVILTLVILIASAGACKKKSEEPVPVPYTSFTLKGVAKTYNYASSFTKDFCSTSTFCCRFTASSDTSSKETLKFGIPGDPVVGQKYETGVYRFSCFYMDAAGVRYELTDSPTSKFTVVFSQWDGQGGWGKGTFSGWMKSPTNDSIQFLNGYFQNKIWTMGTK